MSIWHIEQYKPKAPQAQPNLPSAYIWDSKRSLPDLQAGFRVQSSDQAWTPNPSYLFLENAARLPQIDPFSWGPEYENVLLDREEMNVGFKTKLDSLSKRDVNENEDGYPRMELPNFSAPLFSGLKRKLFEGKKEKVPGGPGGKTVKLQKGMYPKEEEMEYFPGKQPEDLFKDLEKNLDNVDTNTNDNNPSTEVEEKKTEESTKEEEKVQKKYFIQKQLSGGATYIYVTDNETQDKRMHKLVDEEIETQNVWFLEDDEYNLYYKTASGEGKVLNLLSLFQEGRITEDWSSSESQSPASEKKSFPSSPASPQVEPELTFGNFSTPSVLGIQKSTILEEKEFKENPFEPIFKASEENISKSPSPTYSFGSRSFPSESPVEAFESGQSTQTSSSGPSRYGAAISRFSFGQQNNVDSNNQGSMSEIVKEKLQKLQSQNIPISPSKSVSSPEKSGSSTPKSSMETSEPTTPEAVERAKSQKKFKEIQAFAKKLDVQPGTSYDITFKRIKEYYERANDSEGWKIFKKTYGTMQ